MLSISFAIRSTLKVLIRGMPRADGRLEVDIDVAAAGQLEEVGAVDGHHHLVRGNDMLAGADRPLQVAARRLLAAHHLDDDLDRGVVEDVVGPPRQELGRDPARSLEVADQDPAEDQIDPGPRRYQLPFCQQPLGNLDADGPQPEQPYIQLHSRILSCRGHSAPRG